MAKNQGILNYTKGYSRYLTNSEKNRGYLFISNDKDVKSKQNWEIYINKVKIENKKIDNSGRIIAGKKIIHEIGDKQIHFKLVDNILTIIY